MSAAVLAPQPTVPVVDDLLRPAPDAAKSHKDKINVYNSLLEDVYQREIELSNLKASLVDMKLEIVEEGQTLDTSGKVIDPESLRIKAGEADAESSESGEEGSDSSASGEEASADDAKKDKKKKRVRSKGKSKGKGRDATRTEERGAHWDYNLNVSGGNRHAPVANDDE